MLHSRPCWLGTCWSLAALVLAAAVWRPCGEHLLLLGPLGTAKSALSRQLPKALDVPYFELTRFFSVRGGPSGAAV